MSPDKELHEADDNGRVPLSPGGSEELFLDVQNFKLTPEDQLAFVAALESPPTPNAALRGLMGGSKRAKSKK